MAITIDGLRSARVWDMAVFDLVVSFFGIVLIAEMIRRKWFPNEDRTRVAYMAAAATLPLAIATHWFLEIDTALNYKLGISNNPKTV